MMQPLQRRARRVRERLELWRARRRVEQILQRSGPPRPIDDRARLDALLQDWPPRLSYGYDDTSLHRRGAYRAKDLRQRLNLAPGAKVLEIGAGDGMTSVKLAAVGVDATLVDLADWRHESAKGLAFRRADASAGLPCDDGEFDAAYSYNTFEHVPDPAAALAEAERAVRPGGLIRLSFGPLYAGPWGLHAYKTLPVPYPQWLLSERLLDQALREVGINDLGEAERDELQPLNKWRLGRYREAFERAASRIVEWETTVDATGLPIIERYPEAFAGRGLTFADCVTKAIRVTLRVSG